MSVALTEPVSAPRSASRLLALLAQCWPFADQALISGTNFVTTILLARALHVDDFGAFALAYAGLMLFGGIQSALVTQPHNVLGAIREGDAYRRYSTATAIQQSLVAAFSSLVVLAAWGWCLATSRSAAAVLLPLAGTVFAWQLQEFVRRVLYTEGRIAAAFANDLIGYGGQLLLLTMGWYLSALSVSRALHVITATSLLAVLVGGWQLRGSWSRHFDPASVRENWHYGKWLLGACIASEWLATQLFLFVAALALGPASAGILRAFQTVFGPSRIFAQVVNVTLPTRLARAAAASGPMGWTREWHGSLWRFLPILAGYCLLVAIAAEPLLRVTFGNEYASHAGTLRLYSLASLLGYLTIFGAAALRAKRRTRAVFLCEAASLAVIPLCLPLIPWLGLPGVVSGMVAADIALVLLLWAACRQEGGGA